MANRHLKPNELQPWDDKEEYLQVIIETPKGSRNKFAFDDKLGLIRLKSTLAEGMSFPFDFGFLPQTEGEDGDPLDILILMDAPAFPGCLLEARLLGVIEAEQSEGDEMVRNDRLLAVWTASSIYSDIKGIKDVNNKLLAQIQDFFIAYNRARDKEFKVLKVKGDKAARKLIKEGMKKYRKGD